MTDRPILSANAQAMMLAEPESCRFITLDIENRQLFAIAIKEGLRRRSRTEMRLFAEMARYVGSSVHVAQTLFLSLGVRGEDELRSAVQLAKSSEHLSMDECEQDAVALLQLVFSQRPERRTQVLHQLGAQMIEASNGHDNGTSE